MVQELKIISEMVQIGDYKPHKLGENHILKIGPSLSPILSINTLGTIPTQEQSRDRSACHKTRKAPTTEPTKHALLDPAYNGKRKQSRKIVIMRGYSPPSIDSGTWILAKTLDNGLTSPR